MSKSKQAQGQFLSSRLKDGITNLIIDSERTGENIPNGMEWPSFASCSLGLMKVAI